MSIVTIVTLLGAGAGAAQARQAPPPGVHVDPASPTAKEYAVPFDAARAIGRGGRGGNGGSGGAGSVAGAVGVRGSSGDASPLFGAGITPRLAGRALGRSGVGGGSGSRGRSAGPRGSASSTTGTAGTSGTTGTAPGAAGGGTLSGLVPTLTVRPSRAVVPPPGAKGDTGGTSPLLLIAVVLLAGVLIGIPLRRLGRPGPDGPADGPELPA